VLGRNLRTALLVLWGVVAVVLLIACANVANLMLARSAAREKEIALRLALGAGRWRIMRQLLAESLTLSLFGGGLGALLGWGSLRLFLAANPGDIPRLNEVAFDGTALLFTLGVALLTGLLFGLAPAWQFSRPALNEALKENHAGASTGVTAGRTRNLLVVAEVALSVVLLVGAGLMLQTFARVLRAERGFEPAHLVTAELDFSVSGFTTWVEPAATRPQVRLHDLMERLRALPGVQAVGAGSRLFRRENVPPHEQAAIFGRPPPTPEERPRAEFMAVTPDWVRALGGRLLRGRDLAETDTLPAPGAVLINETFARRYFPNEEPVGQRLRMGGGQPSLTATNRWGIAEWSTIVGVVADVKSLHPQPESVPEVYQSYWQWPMQNPTLLIRATGDPATVAEVIRRETRSAIPGIPSPLVRTMDDLLSETVAQPRLQAGLLGLFAGLAVLLAAVGLYGVLAYVVSRRTREIGIRLALGAKRRTVLAMIVRQGMRLALIGAAAGIVAALTLTRLMRGLLHGVSPLDPLTFAAVPVLLAAITLFACWLPARRAAKTDPMEALRSG
jgi:putative ABC transport system permease protein